MRTGRAVAGEGAQTGGEGRRAGASVPGMLEEKPGDRKGVGKETPCVGESMAFSPSQAALVT